MGTFGLCTIFTFMNLLSQDLHLCKKRTTEDIRNFQRELGSLTARARDLIPLPPKEVQDEKKKGPTLIAGDEGSPTLVLQ